MAESQQNPLHDPDGELEQIGKLCREIREGILNLIDTRGQEEQEELNELRTAALIRRAPESTYATLLFRKYADIANDIKDSQHQRGDSIIGDIGTLAVYEPDDEKRLVGWDALRTNIFWLRMGTATLAFISYVLMASVKFINYAKYHPFRYFSVSSFCFVIFVNIIFIILRAPGCSIRLEHSHCSSARPVMLVVKSKSVNSFLILNVLLLICRFEPAPIQTITSVNVSFIILLINRRTVTSSTCLVGSICAHISL